MKKRKSSIMKNLIKSYATILVVVFAVVSIMISVFVTGMEFNRHIENLFTITDNIERWTTAMHIDVTDTRARDALKTSIKGWGQYLKADIVIINNDGEITEGTRKNIEIPADYIEKVLGGEKFVTKGTFNGEYPNKVITVGVPMYYEGSQIGAVFINSWLPDINKSVSGTVLMLIFFCVISLIVAVILVYIQSKKISRPLREINNAARDIAAGNYGERVSIHSSDEIGQLASSFNFMAASIEKSEAQRASFVSDVSHELRTPMTSITGFVEGILDGTIPTENQEKYLKIVLNESRRLTRLVNDLLEMSKMESSEYKLDISQFDINELIRICIINLESRICEKNLDLNIDFRDDELIALGDKDCINRVVLNILDNAVKFSYPNTALTVSTWTEHKKIFVSIGNFGDGIEGEDLANVFKRFYKTDKSRGKEKRGAGLGLALVKNIITMHRQNIWVECNETKEGSGVKFTKFTFTLETA